MARIEAKETGFVFFFIEGDESGQPMPFRVIEFLGREWVVLTMLSDRETQALIPELIMPKGVMEYGSYGPDSYQLGGILPANLFDFPPEPSVLAQYKVQNYFAAYHNVDNQAPSSNH